LKFPALTLHREETVPFPESLTITPAEENGLTVFRIVTPVKALKGPCGQERQRQNVCNDFFSTAVSEGKSAIAFIYPIFLLPIRINNKRQHASFLPHHLLYVSC
jgi:hypothetical protein